MTYIKSKDSESLYLKGYEPEGLDGIEIEAPSMEHIQLNEDGTYTILTDEELLEEQEKQALLEDLNKVVVNIGDTESQITWLQNRVNELETLSDEELEAQDKAVRASFFAQEVAKKLGSKADRISWINSKISELQET